MNSHTVISSVVRNEEPRVLSRGGTLLHKSIFSYLLAFFFFLFCTVIFFGQSLSSFVLNGDDVVMLHDAPAYAHDLVNNLTNFTGQYRPLGRLLYSVYLPLRFHHTAVYFSPLLLFSFVELLFFLLAIQRISKPVSALLTLFIFHNPIFYYHIFTIAGDVNLLIMAIVLLMFICVEKRTFWYVFPLFLLSMLVKETFIVTLPVCIFALWRASYSLRNKMLIACVLLLVFFAYGYARTHNYIAHDPNYSFVFTLEKCKENGANFIAWLVNHPRGNEYGFYGFRNVFNTILSLLLATAWLAGWIVTFIRNKVRFLLILSTLLCGLAPFLFLNRTLVFYMDVPFLMLGLLLIETLAKHRDMLTMSAKTLSPVVLTGLITVPLLSYQLFFSRWVNYSFVGVSNQVANNFVRAVRDGVRKNQDLCILEHGLGAWPTADGKLVYFIDPAYTGKVVSRSTLDVNGCTSSLVLRNQGAEYVP